MMSQVGGRCDNRETRSLWLLEEEFAFGLYIYINISYCIQDNIYIYMYNINQCNQFFFLLKKIGGEREGGWWCFSLLVKGVCVIYVRVCGGEMCTGRG